VKAPENPPSNPAGAQCGTTQSPDPTLSTAHFLWVLGNLCRIHRIAFDPNLILQRFPRPHSLSTLTRAAGAVGLDIEQRPLSAEDTTDRQAPCLVFQQAPSEERQPDTPNHDGHGADLLPALLSGDDSGRLMVYPAGGDRPEPMTRGEISARFEDFCLLPSPTAVAPPEEPSEVTPKRFGFRWFVPELLRYKRVWRDVLLASLAIQVLGLATPLFTQVVIDKVIVHHTLNTLYVVAFALFMFMAFGAVMTWIRQYLVLHTGNRVDAVLGSRVVEHLFNLPLGYFERRPTGTLVARIQGVETIREFISGAAVTFLLDVPFLVVFLAVMFYYSWQLSLVVLAILSVIAVLSLAVAPTLRRRLNEQFKLGARNQAFLTEYIAGAETVKSLQMEPRLRGRFDDYLAAYLGAGFRTRTLSNTYNVAANTLEQFQVLAVLGLGAWLVMTTDGFTVGMLVAFQMFAARLAQPVLRLVGLWLEFQQANIAVQRLGDIMDAPAEPYSAVPTRAPGGDGRVDIQDLGFRYDENRPFLYRGFNLKIPAGSTVALMGPSGCGKSTLAKLLQGFYPADEGRVLIDGRDIRHLSANELRQHFGVVPQETTLFSGSVYDNLLAADPHADFARMVQACRLAEIHDTIERLPDGYHTRLGEHGTGLSGGQKQRLAIARALLKRPRILIFDEATSHLDPATAEHLATTVNALKGKVTILFIAHQLPKGLQVDEAVILGSRGQARPGAERDNKEG
jgi:subfamily B ATP-binding cassette protein HlyB/CyaB